MEFVRPAQRGRRPKWCDRCAEPERMARRRAKARRHYARIRPPRLTLKCLRCHAALPSNSRVTRRFCNGACAAAARPPADNKVSRTCETCGASVVAPAGSKRRWCSKACQPKALRGLFSCLHCGKEYRKKRRRPGEGEKFCTRACCFAAKSAAAKAAAPPRFSTYIARRCSTCGEPGGKRREWLDCDACTRAAQLERGRRAALAASEALHRAAARELRCEECAAVFCPLYGSKHGAHPLCIVCAPIRKRRQHKDAKALREAVKRGAPGGTRVSDESILRRDGWRCRFCGIPTPQDLRGTNEHNAPEVDHVIPVSRGGLHEAANLQCLCRSCNGLKSNRTMAEFEAWLQSEPA